MKSLVQNESADPKLYRVYWRLCLSDILFHLGYEPTTENKLILHEFHKRVLGYKTTANRSQEVVSRFIAEVCVFWADQGIFVRTSKKQPLWIELMDLHDVWKLL
jgi:hypothetical protein